MKHKPYTFSMMALNILFKPPVIFMLIAMFFVTALPALAQSGDDKLPQTAVEGLQWIINWMPTLVVIVCGWVGSRLTDALKIVAWLSPASKTGLHRLVIELISLALPGLLTIAVAEAGPLAQWLDGNGVWGLIVAAAMVAKGVWFSESLRKSLKVLAQAKAGLLPVKK